jgi:hypothetical protein
MICSFLGVAYSDRIYKKPTPFENRLRFLREVILIGEKIKGVRP